MSQIPSKNKNDSSTPTKDTESTSTESTKATADSGITDTTENRGNTENTADTDNKGNTDTVDNTDYTGREGILIGYLSNTEQDSLLLQSPISRACSEIKVRAFKLRLSYV